MTIKNLSITEFAKRNTLSLATVFLAACATLEPKPVEVVGPPETYENNFTNETACVGTGPCHRYEFTFPTGQTVVLRARSETIGLALIAKNAHSSLPTQVSMPGGEVAVTFESKGRIQLLLAAKDWGQKGEYELVVDPAPTKIHRVPLTASEKADKETAEEQRRAAVIEQRKRRRPFASILKEAKASRCTATEFAVYYAAKIGGVVTHYFCDGARVHKMNDGRRTVSFVLSGARYDSYTQNVRDRKEIAEHNYRVLPNATTQRQAARARSAFEARIVKYLKRHRKPQDKYLKQVRTVESKLVVVDH